MASVGFQVHDISDEVKYDAFPFVGTEKSSCDAVKIDLSDIRVDESNTYSDSETNADKKEKYHMSLSDKRTDNQLSFITPCKGGVSSQKAFGDQNSTDFLDFTSSDSYSTPMKFKDISECEGNESLSDLLSSLSNNPSKSNTFHVTHDNKPSDVFNPKLHQTETHISQKQTENIKLTSDNSLFDLSDILSSLSVEDGSHSKLSPFKNSSNEISDKSLCLDDFKILNPGHSTVENPSTEKNQENLSDLFSSLDISKLKSNKLETSRKSDLSPFKLRDESFINTKEDFVDEGFSGLMSPVKTSEQDKAGFDDFNIDDLGESVSIWDYNDKKKDEKQNAGLSFSKFSKNDPLLLQMLDRDLPSEAPRHEYYSSSGDSGISVMDFLGSMENSKERTPTSEDDFDKYSSNSEDQAEELKAVDLNFCVKALVDKLDPSIRSASNKPHHLKQFENVDTDSEINSLPLKHSVTTVTSHKTSRQSLFSKSFSGKSKTDAHVIHEVANIKAGLLNNAFKRSTPVNFHCKTPLPNAASFSDNPTTSYAGRRLFNSTGVSVIC